MARRSSTFARAIAASVRSAGVATSDAAIARRTSLSASFGSKHKANVSVEPDLADNLSVGIFEGGRTYKAWIRFSNAADVVTPDTEEDFRGMAIKLFDVPGEKLPVPGDEESTQDLLFIAHDAFFAGSPRHFHDFFAACVAGGGVCDPLRNLHEPTTPGSVVCRHLPLPSTPLQAARRPVGIFDVPFAAHQRGQAAAEFDRVLVLASLAPCTT